MRSSSIILYIDTSSSTLIAGLVKENTVIKDIHENLGKELSLKAVSLINKMFTDSNTNFNDIEKIIVVDGPGSFTGVRIGITIAKTMSWTLSKNITTITSLEAMAISSNYNGYKVPILDARRNCVYTAIFDKDNNKIMPEQYINLTELEKNVQNLDSKYVYISNDDIDIEKVMYEPDILKIVLAFKNKENINPHEVNPEYFKHTEAEETKGLIFDD